MSLSKQSQDERGRTMAKLSESTEVTIERPNVTLKLTINPQRGLTGVPVVDVPSYIEQLDDDLKVIATALGREAEEVADLANMHANGLDGGSADEIVARHCDTRKLSTDSNGSSIYLRVLMTSTKPLPQITMFDLVDALLEYFKEYVHKSVKAANVKMLAAARA